MSSIVEALLRLQNAIQGSDAASAKLRERQAHLKNYYAPAKVARREFNGWAKSDVGQAFKQKIYQEQGCRCANPGCDDGLMSIQQFQIDHIKPLSKFPELALVPKNLQLLCS